MVIRYRTGENTNQLAKIYGVHKTTVSNHLKKAGVNVTLRKEGEAFDADEVIRLYVGEGMKSKDIGKLFGVGEQTIRKYLNEHGIKMRTRWDYPRK